MLHLRTLVSMDLRDSDGIEITSILSQPKRFALLVYLATARPLGLHRRDTLLTLFWSERDDFHGRNALSQSISYLRQNLSENVILTSYLSGVMRGLSNSSLPQANPCPLLPSSNA